jgi:hypothetical protein
MNPNGGLMNAGLMVLTGLLVLVTAYYAWIIRRFLGAFQDMVEATKEMVETAARTYALSVVPRVECRTVHFDGAQAPAAGATAEQVVSETTITNIGAHRVRLSRVRVETDSGGEHVRRFVTRWLEPGDRETVQIPYGRSSHARIFVHLEDLAGQDHVVESKQL